MQEEQICLVNMNFTSTNIIVLPDVIPFQTTLLFLRYVCCSNYVCINARICIKQEAGVKGSLTNIEEFSLSLIPFDYDLLSMEMDNSFNVSISSNHICIYSFSSSGKTVNKETNFGKIYHIGLTCQFKNTFYSELHHFCVEVINVNKISTTFVET